MAEKGENMFKLIFDGANTYYRGENGMTFPVSAADSGIGSARAERLATELTRRTGMEFSTDGTAESLVYVGKSAEIPFLGLAESNGNGGNAFVNLDATASDELLLAVISHEAGHLAGTLVHGGEGLASCAYIEGETVTINNGETLGAETIASGAFITDPYARIVKANDGATLNGTIIESGGTVFISNGAVGDNLVVKGGITKQNVSSALAWVYVSSGGVLNNLTVEQKYNYANPHVFISSGATLNGGTIKSGRISINGGANAYNLIDSGSIYVYGYLSGGRVDAGEVKASSGGLIEDYVVKGGGMYVQGGTISNTLVSGANLHVGYSNVKGGVASDTRLVVGSMIVSTGTLASDTYLSGGEMHVSSGGRASGVFISSGTLTVSKGGVLSGATVSATGLPTRRIFVYSSGTGYNINISGAGGSMRVSGISAFVSGATAVNGGAYILAEKGGVISGATVKSDGIAYASAGGTVSGFTMNENGSVFIYGVEGSQGAFIDAENTAGTYYIHSYGVLSNATIGGGYIRLRSGNVSGATMTGGTIYTVDQDYLVSSGGATFDLTMRGGTLNVSLGSAVRTTFSGGAINVRSGGLLSNFSSYQGTGGHGITVSSGGVAKNGELYGKNASMRVSSGGYAEFVAAYDKAYILTISQGVISNGYVGIGGSGFVSSTGVFNETTVSGAGAMLYVYNAATFNDLTLLSGATLDFRAGASGANLKISGGIINGQNNNATLYLDNKEIPYENVTIIGAGNIRTSAGTTVNTMLVSGGNASARAYGDLNDLTVNGGYVWLMGNAVGKNVTLVDGGRLNLWDGTAKASNVVVNSGATIFAQTAASAYNYDVRSGAEIRMNKDTSGAFNFIWCGENTRIEQGVIDSFGAGFYAENGEFRNLILSGGTARIGENVTIVSGGKVDKNGLLYIHDGGVADRTVVDSGGTMSFNNGAVGNGIQVQGGSGTGAYAMLYANSGAVVNDLYVSRGPGATTYGTEQVQIYSGATLNRGDIKLGRITIRGNAYDLVNSGSIYVTDGGYLSGVLTMRYETKAYSGGLISGATVSGGGLYAQGGTFYGAEVRGGTMVVGFDGSAGFAKDVLVRGGDFHLSSGASVEDLKLHMMDISKRGAKLIYVSGGTVNGLRTLGKGGNVYISANATVNNAKIGGDFIRVFGTVNNGEVTSGELWTSSGGVINDITAYTSAATVYVMANGTANNTVLSGGSIALRGGAANNVTMVDGTLETTQIYDGKEQTPGGTVTGLAMSGGTLEVRSGAVTGATVTGGTINVTSGGQATFDSVSGETTLNIDYSDGTSAARIASLLPVSAGVDINVYGLQADETYALATTGNTGLTVKVASGLYKDAVSVGTDYTNAFAGMTYSFDGTNVETETFTVTSMAAAGKLTSGTASLLNTNDLAAKWVGNTTSVTGNVYLAEDMNSGAAWLELDGYQGETTNIFGAQGTTFANGTVNLYAKSGKIANLAGGANKNGTVGNVNLTFDGGEVTGLALAGGQGNVTGAVKTLINGGTFGSSFVAGTYSNKVKTEVGSVELTINGGTFRNNVFGGTQVKYTNAETSTVDSITVNLNGVDSVIPGFSLYAGGIAAGSNQSTTAYSVNSVTVNVTGGNWGSALGGHGIFGGIFTGDLSGNTGVTAEVTDTVTIDITGGTLGNVYGGGWAQQGGKSIVHNVNISVKGATVGNIFGGGIHSNSTTSKDVSASLVTGDVNITIHKSAVVTGSIYARGQAEGDTVTGNSTVTILGYGRYARDCNIYGYDYVGAGSTPGESTNSYLVFKDNTDQNLTGNIGGFDDIKFTGNTSVTFGAAAENIDNDNWSFDLVGRSDIMAGDAILNWSSGSFEGDTATLYVGSRNDGDPTSWTIADGLTSYFTAGGSYSVYDNETLLGLLTFDSATATETNVLGGESDYKDWGLKIDGTTLSFAKLA